MMAPAARVKNVRQSKLNSAFFLFFSAAVGDSASKLLLAALASSRLRNANSDASAAAGSNAGFNKATVPPKTPAAKANFKRELRTSIRANRRLKNITVVSV